MLKWLTIFLGVTGLIVTIVLMTCKYQNSRKEQVRTATELSLPTAISPPQDANSKKQCSDCTGKTPCWYILLAWPEGITVWVVILTFAVIGWQADETRKTAEATQCAVALQERTAKRQLRAYMAVRKSRLILHEDGSVEAKIKLANCGQTPAYDLKGGVYCRFDMYPIRDIKPIPDDLRQSQGTVGAGLACWLLPPGGRHDKGNRGHLLNKLSAVGGNLVYCANGYFTYRDTFQDPHWIKFQMIVGGPGSVRVDTDGNQQWAVFSTDSEGNEEDQDS